MTIPNKITKESYWKSSKDFFAIVFIFLLETLLKYFIEMSQ